MAKEIELKYTVTKTPQLGFYRSSEIVQGYFDRTEDGAAIRIRIVDREVAFLTIKSKAVGLTRNEFEYEIPVGDAFQMMNLFCSSRLEKTRHYIPHGFHLIELDVFEGHLRGLVLAEIELKSEDTNVAMPEWFDKNVSRDPNYTNERLAAIAGKYLS